MGERRRICELKHLSNRRRSQKREERVVANESHLKKENRMESRTKEGESPVKKRKGRIP